MATNERTTDGEGPRVGRHGDRGAGEAVPIFPTSPGSQAGGGPVDGSPGESGPAQDGPPESSPVESGPAQNGPVDGGELDRRAVDAAADALNEALDVVLRWASRADVRRTRAGSAGAGLSSTDAWLLGAIESQGPVRLSDLARWQGVDKSTMTPQVRRIEDRGLIRRDPDPNDRRAALLSVTDHGRDVRRRLARGGAALVESVLATWPAEERETLAALFTRFTHDLESLRSGRLGERP